MVKVKKPKPKSLNKLAQGNVDKTKKKEPSTLAKAGAGKKQKQLLQTTVKSAEIVTPVKKVNKKEKAVKEIEKVKPVSKPIEKKKPTKKVEVAAKHKPLVLPPPESPVSTPAPPKKPVEKKKPTKKVEVAAKHKPLVLPPPESPVTTPAPPKKPVEKKKQTKKVEEAAKQKPLVLPPPESPASAPAPTKKQAVKKNEKKAKAPLVAAPDDSPVVKQTKKRQSIAALKKAKKALKPKAQLATKSAKTVEPSKPLTKKQRTKTIKRAFLKTKRARNLSDEATKEKKKKPVRAVTIEPTNFDEEKFHKILNQTNVEKIAEALKTLVEEEVKKQKTSIFSDYRYFLNVASFKIPNVPKRMVKLNLKHSLINDDEDVAIIVPDLQRGAKVEYEPTIQHYEDLFREAGVVRPLKIIPFNQLRNEMNTYEAKRKFCNSYDYFLCDGRLVGQAHSFLGKFTQKPRAVLHAVRLIKSNVKDEIERGLRRTAYRQIQKGDLTSIPVGSHHYTVAQVSENILYVIEQLKTLQAGGYANIRSLHLKIDIRGTSSLPLYISTSLPPPETPFVIGPREERMLKLKSDANKVLANFTLTKDATLIKLNPTQVEHKRKLREAHAALTQEKAEETVDNDGDDSQVPTKKARKEENVKDDVKKSTNAEDDSGEDEEEDEDADDDDVDSDDEEGAEGDSDEEVDEDAEEGGDDDDDDDDDEEAEDDDDDEEDEDDDDE